MAKGAEGKSQITDVILEHFGEAAFVLDKTIYVNVLESDGQTAQIKIAMTCAKTPINRPDNAAPVIGTPISGQTQGTEFKEPDEAEMQNLEELSRLVGLI